ncbi:MAG: hypothetical protein GY871_11965 [Actinomycetales bacterium]|nr:hypothetical protein [Actinomycetales bacterium]
MPRANISDEIVNLMESAVKLALVEDFLTERESDMVEAILGEIAGYDENYLDIFYPDPDDGDECFTDEYGWSPEGEDD